MEARFTARQVWDVRAARALLHIVQKPSARRVGLAMLCAAALCWGLSYAPGMRSAGQTLALALAAVGVLALLFLERAWARPIERDRRTRGPELALAFGEEAVEARNECGSTRYAYGLSAALRAVRGATCSFTGRSRRSSSRRRASPAATRPLFAPSSAKRPA